MPHLDEGLLNALLDHELDETERLAAEGHLAACGDCRRLLDEVKALATEADRLVATVELPPARAAAAGGPPLDPASPSVGTEAQLTTEKALGARRPRTAPRWRSIAWAASVVLAAGLGWYVSDLRIAPHDQTLGDARREVGYNQAPARPESAPVPSMKTAEAPAPAPAQAAPAPALAGGRTPVAQATSNQPTKPARADAEARDLLATGVSEGVSSAAKVSPPAAPPSAAPALGLERSGQVLMPRNATTVAKEAKDADESGFREVPMEEAVRTLAGSIRLVDGLQPDHILRGTGNGVSGADPALPLVRVVYQDPPGRELWLDQQRPLVDEGARLRASAGLLVGDTVVTRGPDGLSSLRWIDEHGFRLALTGFLPADSLHSLMLRVH
jgi:hypothetical protein